MQLRFGREAVLPQPLGQGKGPRLAIRCAAMRGRWATWPFSVKVLLWLVVALVVLWVIAFLLQRGDVTVESAALMLL